MPRFLDEIQYYDSNGILQTVKPTGSVYLHYIMMQHDNPDSIITFSLPSNSISPLNNYTALVNAINVLGATVILTASGIFKASSSVPLVGVIGVYNSSSSIFVRGYDLETGEVAVSRAIPNDFEIYDTVARI